MEKKMLKKLEMLIPTELLGLSDINIVEINLRDNHDLIIKVESTQKRLLVEFVGKFAKLTATIVLWS